MTPATATLEPGDGLRFPMLQELTFHTLDVFTDRIFGGNQLAVFPNPPELPTDVLQSIAREFNLSETVFVYPARLAGTFCKLRIFTPQAELPFAGHPTIGTAQLLVELGIARAGADGSATYAFEEGVGRVPVEVMRTETGGYFTWLTTAQLPERREDAPAREVLAAIIGVVPEEILQDEQDAPIFWSAGLPFLCIPVRDREVLARATLDVARWRQALANSWAQDVYVFCHEPEGSEVDVRARMFAPAAGITEDPATGSAAAAFAGYLWKRTGGPGQWVIAQGVEMGRPSTLYVDASGEESELQTVKVGGTAVRVSSGILRLDLESD